MIKIYGASICKDCVALKERLDSNNKAYEYIDITKTTSNLKEFLKIRDTNPLYDEIKNDDLIGIPLIILEDGSLLLDPDKLDINALEDGNCSVLEGSACDIKAGKC